MRYQSGGPADVLARAFAQQLARRFGQAVLLENKAGARGDLGMAAPAGTPRPILDRLATALPAIGRQPTIRARMVALAPHAALDGAAAFRASYQSSLPIRRKMGQESGARLDGSRFCAAWTLGHGPTSWA